MPCREPAQRGPKWFERTADITKYTESQKALQWGNTVESARRSLHNKGNQPALSVEAAARLLWGGFSRYGLKALSRIIEYPPGGASSRVQAQTLAAQWHALEGNLERAGQVVKAAREEIRDYDLLIADYREVYWLDIDLAIQAGQQKRARQAANELYEAVGEGDRDSLLWCLNAQRPAPSDRFPGDPWLDTINRVYHREGLARIGLNTHSENARINHLSGCKTDSGESAEQPKVSVLVAMYNASDTLEIALDSLLGQTWNNLEIIVVDDGSTDDTWGVLQDKYGSVPGVQLLRNEQNYGAYASRNRALLASTGDFVTAHDADDWSHPQKIELLASALGAMLERGDPGVVYCNRARVRENLRFVGSWRPGDRILRTDLPSLMMPRSIVNELGGWDPVRVGADKEFMLRLRRRYGREAMRSVCAAAPLTFSLVSETSLTSERGASLRTLRWGLRHDYRRLVEAWHYGVSMPDELWIDPAAGPDYRPFFAPRAIRAVDRFHPSYAAILVLDLSLARHLGRPFRQWLEGLRTQSDPVGIMDWPHPLRNYTRRQRARYLDWYIRKGFALISPGEQAQTHRLVCIDSPALEWVLDSAPTIITQGTSHLVSAGEGLEASDSSIEQRLANLRAVLGPAALPPSDPKRATKALK